MRRMRIGLLLAATVHLALSPSALAQVAPTLTGDTGLIQTVNGETVPPGLFSFGLYGNRWQLMAAPPINYPVLAGNPLRYGEGKLGISVTYGILPGWEASIVGGGLHYTADSRAWTGNINGRDVSGGFSTNETDKIRIGSKLILNSRDPLRVALFGGIWIPTGGGVGDPDSFSTGKADYDFGLSFNYDWASVQIQYFDYADYGTPSPNPVTPSVGASLPSQWIWSFGGAWPILNEHLRLIGEINRNFFSGGQTAPASYSEALLGARFFFGNESGLSATGAVRINIDQWANYGTSPNPIGGYVQIAWAPRPPAPPRSTVQVAPREAEAPTAAAPPPAPAPAPAPAPGEAAVAEAAPAPRTTTTTTDEVLFDANKSRLTNIAKAILDGVALRLKNNLSATCSITATTDAKEKGNRQALATARAEAAKDYLVKRHGIDPGRITVSGMGDGGATDATRNRRAVVTVTFP